VQGSVPSREAHLALYSEVDVALDTFPYNGTTTTCEALWMGVPVVTLAGELHAGRVGASLLHQCGLDDWVAATPERYVSLALAVAANLPERRILREWVAESGLTDAPRFAVAWEEALRRVWRDYCAAHDGSA